MRKRPILRSLPHTVGLLAAGAVFVLWARWVAVEMPHSPGGTGLLCFLPLTTPLLLWVIAAALIGGAEPGIFGGPADDRSVRLCRLALKCALLAIGVRFALGLACAPGIWPGMARGMKMHFAVACAPGISRVLWFTVLGLQWLGLLTGSTAVLGAAVAGAETGGATEEAGRGVREPRPEWAWAVRVVARLAALVAFLWWGALVAHLVSVLWSGQDSLGRALLYLPLASGLFLALTGMTLPSNGRSGYTPSRLGSSLGLLVGVAAVAGYWDVRWAASSYVPLGSPDAAIVIEVFAVGLMATVGAWIGTSTWLILGAEWILSRWSGLV